jgi:hypothetical protein
VKGKNSKGRISAMRKNEPSLEKDKPRFFGCLGFEFKNI